MKTSASRPVASLARRSLLASLAVHVLAASALALSPWARVPVASPYDDLEFLGRKGVVLIEASFAEPTPPPEAVVELPRLEAPVEVTPREARVAQRTYVQTTTTVADFAAAIAETPADDAEISPSAVAPRRQEASDDAAPLETSSSAPSLPRAAASPPMTAGFESAASFAGNPPPVYPAIAVQNRWSGSVILKLHIDETGAVSEVVVERSSGYPVLDAAAVNAVRQWRGTPRRVNGRAVASDEIQEIKFLPRR